MTELAFRDFLQDSLAAIERDVPRGYAQLATQLARHCVRLEVDRQSVCVAAPAGALQVLESGSRAHHAAARFSRPLLAEMLRGRVSLLDAILDDRFELFGAPADLAVFDNALGIYFACGLRCNAFPALLSAFLGGA